MSEPDPELVEIGRRIKRRRTDLGLTLEQLAYKTGYMKSALSFYESGERRMPLTKLVRIAKALRCSVASLAGDDDVEEWVDEEAARYYNGIAPDLRPKARDILRTLSRQDDAES